MGLGINQINNSNSKPENNLCAPIVDEKKRNELSSRVFVAQYPANDPCEDRFNCVQLRNIDGYYMAVFDGHGGWQVSEHAMRKLHVYLDEELKGAKTEDQIKKAITTAFDRVEKDWYELTKLGFEMGFPKTAYMGSCALIGIVKDNKLYIANAGDSKGVLIRGKEDGSFEAVNISTTFNGNKKYEQERLKEQFKGDKDIIRCKKLGYDEKETCYVKGGLMPTRAIGDLRLKHQEFNKHMRPPEQKYRNPIPDFNGPYITHQPEIKVIELTKDDQFIIMASDGLWDEISRKKAAEVLKGVNVDDMKNIASILLEEALQNASKKSHVSREFIAQIAPSKQKRSYIDDITILVVNLKNQFK